MLTHLDHFALGALHADAEREVAHERAEQGGVELIGVAVRRSEALVLGGRPELVGQRGLDGERVGADRLRATLALHLEPVVVEADAGDFLAERAERVHVALADPAEVAEVDAELVGRVGRLDERGLVDPEPLDEAADVRQRRLADADDANVLAFDQVDRDQRTEQLLQRGGAHPPGGAAAEDDDAGGRGCAAHLALCASRFRVTLPIPSSSWRAKRSDPGHRPRLRRRPAPRNDEIL